MTLLAPGSVNPNPGSFTGPQTTAASGRPYVNGNREQSDNFMLDGVDNNQASDNLVGYTPSEDAIQEFSMITNNASAEFGNFQGAIINTTIKSGTNQLHGDAFEFFRNDVLNAANWGSNYQIPHVDKGKLRWNEFGATVGGPIRKDKLFYFGDYQGERWDSPASAGRATVFTDKERAGDFSEICQTGFTAGLCNPAPAGSGLLAIQLYNPFQVTSGNRAPIPNNNLAAAGLTIDPVANKLFTSSFYPAQIPGFGARNGLQSNQLNTTRSETVGDQFDVKLDYTLSEKDRISGRYSQSRSASPNFNSFALFFNGFYNTPTRSTVIDWTRNINPAMVNEARVGFNYVKLNNGGADNGLGNVGTTLGIPGANDRGPGLPSICGFTYVSCIGNSNIGTQQLFADTSIPFSDDMTITHGRHIFHSGFQLIRSRIDTFYAGNYGRTGGISFNGQYTAGPSGSATSGTVGCTSGTPPCVPTSAANPPFSLTIGFPEADFWLGFPNDIQRGVDTGTWGQRSNMYAGYFQDDWRATDNLTVNLGLRYETHTPWVEVRDRQANFGLISGTEYFAGKSGCPYSNCRALYNSYNGGFDFQPRLGFAWTPGFLGKAFVVRGAYSASSYLEGTGTNLRLPLNPPFAEEHNTIYNPGDPSSIGNSTDNGFTVLTSPTDPFANAVIRLWNPDVRLRNNGTSQPSISSAMRRFFPSAMSGRTLRT